MITPQKFTSRLASIQKISSKVYLERFDLIEPKEITFFPGQTVMFQVAPGVNRSMSVASAPSEKGSIVVAHDISPMGAYSKWAMSAKAGDMMRFVGPLGMFVLDGQSPRKRVFVATGTGVAPFRSMLLDVFSKPEALNSKLKYALYWGLRHEEDIFWKEELKALAVKHPNFRFALTLSQPSDSWTETRGRVGDHVFTMEQDLKNCDFYLCGNKPMVSEMEATLLANDVPKAQIKKELFY